MRKINKACNKATKYLEWWNELDESCTPYYSSNKFCKDIRANLTIVQDGLCAYTEIALDDVDQITDEDWKDGCYVGKGGFQGHLDHFDSTLKTKGKASWDWENLFVVHGAINNRKNDSSVLKEMKPDSLEYDPFKYLDYDIDEHIFIVSPLIKDENKRREIEQMINQCLFLNYGCIQRMRKRYLDDIFSEYYAGLLELDELKTYQFITAFTFVKLKEAS